MKRSDGRVLTTHTGRLDGPTDLSESARAPARQESGGVEGHTSRLHSGVVDLVKRQLDAGLDVVSDRELGKLNPLAQLNVRPVSPDEPPGMWERTGDRTGFAEFYDHLGFRTQALVEGAELASAQSWQD